MILDGLFDLWYLMFPKKLHNNIPYVIVQNDGDRKIYSIDVGSITPEECKYIITEIKSKIVVDF